MKMIPSDQNDADQYATLPTQFYFKFWKERGSFIIGLYDKIDLDKPQFCIFLGSESMDIINALQDNTYLILPACDRIDIEDMASGKHPKWMGIK